MLVPFVLALVQGRIDWVCGIRRGESRGVVPQPGANQQRQLTVVTAVMVPKGQAGENGPFGPLPGSPSAAHDMG